MTEKQHKQQQGFDSYATATTTATASSWSRKSTHGRWPMIADAVRSGTPPREVATAHGVSYETVMRACRAHGVVRGRGFASMDRAKHRAIAAMGGRAAQATGKIHRFTPEEARRAGRRGWEVSPRTREQMAEIARKGRLARRRPGRPGEDLP